jgi:hypothetical protein
MSIHEHLPKPIRRELKEVGWSKAVELVKVARRDQQNFESATWLHKMPPVPPLVTKLVKPTKITSPAADEFGID